jgi:hypothetical protein
VSEGMLSDMLDLFLEALPEIKAMCHANKELRAALILARDSHGASLLTDPLRTPGRRDVWVR